MKRKKLPKKQMHCVTQSLLKRYLRVRTCLVLLPIKTFVTSWIKSFMCEMMMMRRSILNSTNGTYYHYVGSSSFSTWSFCRRMRLQHGAYQTLKTTRDGCFSLIVRIGVCLPLVSARLTLPMLHSLICSASFSSCSRVYIGKNSSWRLKTWKIPKGQNRLSVWEFSRRSWNLRTSSFMSSSV